MTQRKRQRPAFYGSNDNTASESYVQRTNYSTYVDQVSDPDAADVAGPRSAYMARLVRMAQRLSQKEIN